MTEDEDNMNDHFTNNTTTVSTRKTGQSAPDNQLQKSTYDNTTTTNENQQPLYNQDTPQRSNIISTTSIAFDDFPPNLQAADKNTVPTTPTKKPAPSIVKDQTTSFRTSNTGSKVLALNAITASASAAAADDDEKPNKPTDKSTPIGTGKMKLCSPLFLGILSVLVIAVVVVIVLVVVPKLKDNNSNSSSNVGIYSTRPTISPTKKQIIRTAVPTRTPHHNKTLKPSKVHTATIEPSSAPSVPLVTEIPSLAPTKQRLRTQAPSAIPVSTSVPTSTPTKKNSTVTSPVFSPVEVPTSRRTITPTILCRDNSTQIVIIDGINRDCQYVANNPFVALKYCQNDTSVRDACIKTCNNCPTN
jgi:hypothetical protein